MHNSNLSRDVSFPGRLEGRPCRQPCWVERGSSVGIQDTGQEKGGTSDTTGLLARRTCGPAWIPEGAGALNAVGKEWVGASEGNHFVAARRRAERVADSTPHGPHFVTEVTHPPPVYSNALI
jgi:hypothetical protein